MSKAKTLPARSKIPKPMTWNLDPLYSSIDDWEKDFAKLGGLLKKFLRFEGKLSKGPKKIAEALRASDALERLLEKVYTYTHLKSDEDTANSENRARLDRVTAKYAEIEGETAWFDPEILEIPPKTLARFMKSKKLAFYRRTLEELLRDRPHTLPAGEERLLGLASDVLSTPHKSFSLLNNADLRFPLVKDTDGKEIELTHGNYLSLMESPSREVRKNAFTALYDTYSKYRNTLSSLLSGAVRTHVFEAKIRKHHSALAASLHDDNIPESLYNNLISTAHTGLPELHRYFALRARAMKLDKLDMYDIYNPLVPECHVKISWKDACKWVCEALAPLGEEYVSIVQRACSERWIDVLECRGKKSGAYSSGCYDSPPYVLMNYNGTLKEVFTLAHELGHSLHSYYSDRAQDYHYAGYSIFVAEVASTTNELLLNHYLMTKSADPSMRLYLLNHLADEIRGTLFRQTMFAEFEKNLHERAEKGESLTADALSESYESLNACYHGRPVKPDSRIRMEWARIPHFYYNFYVYKYATGISAAAALSQGILSGKKERLDAYLNFLKAGDSRDVLDIMLDAGVDLRKPAPVKAAIGLFGDTVKKMEELLPLMRKGKAPCSK